jgi:hypothetical protein
VPPTFDLAKLPGSEHTRALHIHASLCKMTFHCHSIEAGVALLERGDALLAKADSTSGIQYVDHWKLMALRDGAITINNFYEEINEIDKNLRKCPTIKRLIDIQQKRKAKRLFEGYFPSCVDLRHGVAHLAEFYGTPEKLKEHGGGWINTMIDRSYHTSIKGKAVSYDLVAATHKKLQNVERRMWAIFKPLIGQGA